MFDFHQMKCYAKNWLITDHWISQYFYFTFFFFWVKCLFSSLFLVPRDVWIRKQFYLKFIKVEVLLWHRSEISLLLEHKTKDYKWKCIEESAVTSWILLNTASVRLEASRSVVRLRTLPQTSTAMCLLIAPPCGCMLRVHPVFVSSVSPRVCLMQACRPCHVSHTEPNAINVSAHGGGPWRRGHRRPGGSEPKWPPQHPTGQHQQHVSRLKEGMDLKCSALKWENQIKSHICNGFHNFYT